MVLRVVFEDHFAVPALAQVSFDLGARLRGDRLVDHVVENREKLSAGHFFNSVSSCAGAGAGFSCGSSG